MPNFTNSVVACNESWAEHGRRDGSQTRTHTLCILPGSMLLRSNMGVRPLLAALSTPMTLRPSFSNWSMLSWRTSPRNEPVLSCRGISYSDEKFIMAETQFSRHIGAHNPPPLVLVLVSAELAHREPQRAALSCVRSTKGISALASTFARPERP
jgi:hypothetical protein